MPLRSALVLGALLLTNSLRAAEPTRIGEAAGKLTFTDIRYLTRSLDDFGKKKAIVLVFVNTSCPLAKRYLPVLQAMETEYRGKDVQFVAVNPADEDSIVASATLAVRHEIEFPIVKDSGGAAAKALSVRRTPEVIVLDGERKLRYRGRIDDQFRLAGTRKEATTHDLKNALDAVLAGRKVETPETEVDGCAITFRAPAKPREVTYAGHVAPILRKHCWECHQAGGSAPFSLTSYKTASAKAAAVAEVVAEQRMPPWFASHEFGPFVNRRGLSDDERSIVVAWAKAGAPRGDPTSEPAPPEPAKSKWLIGEPDLVLTSIELDVPATGDIPYKNTVLFHVFAEDTWIQAAQILPGNPQVLHHCNMAFASLTEGFNESNFITGYVPGGEPMNLDDGMAFRIRKNSVLGLQIHFVPTGKPEKCSVSVGLRFPRSPVQKRLQSLQVSERRFAIPPGAPAHKVAASRVLDCEASCVGLFAHMHLRGKDMTFTAHTPAGPADTLLVIPNYNFGWQLPYRFEPGKKVLPKGTRLECVAHYDNSPFNPFNPDPKATVRNGPQTHHEMMFGFVFFTDANEKLGLAVDPKTGREQKQDAKW